MSHLPGILTGFVLAQLAAAALRAHARRRRARILRGLEGRRA